MSFKAGDKIRTHDGRVHVMDRADRLPESLGEGLPIRGFLRTALVSTDGTEQVGDWYENVITVFGWKQIIRNFVGMHSASTTGTATGAGEMAFAKWFALGSVSNASTDFSTLSTLGSEVGISTTAISTQRAAASSGSAVLSSIQTLYQSIAYPVGASGVVGSINAIGMHYHSSVNVSGSLLSLATFAGVTKTVDQALNVSYNFVFGT